MAETFARVYGRYCEEREHDDATRVGHRRYMVTVELSGAFADPVVYANPQVMQVVRDSLGASAIIETFGVVVSLPGAEAQHRHRDGSPLFDSLLIGMLPAHALTAVFPLLEMNAMHGTTALWSGSHRYPEQVDEASRIEPTVPVGGCVIWDYRLLHGGTPNLSTHVRPILYCTYARDWWHDASNSPAAFSLPSGSAPRSHSVCPMSTGICSPA